MICHLSGRPAPAPEVSCEDPRRDREQLTAASIGCDPGGFLALLDGRAELRVALPDGPGRAGAVADERLAHSVGITPPAVIGARSLRDPEGQPHTDVPAEPADMQYQDAPDEPAAPRRPEARNTPPGFPEHAGPAIVAGSQPEGADSPGVHRATAQGSPRRTPRWSDHRPPPRAEAPDEPSAQVTRRAGPAHSALRPATYAAAALHVDGPSQSRSVTGAISDNSGADSTRSQRLTSGTPRQSERVRDVAPPASHDDPPVEPESSRARPRRSVVAPETADPRGSARDDVPMASRPASLDMPPVQRRPDSSAVVEEAFATRRRSSHLPVGAPVRGTELAAGAEHEPIAPRVPQGPRPPHAAPASLLDGQSEPSIPRPQVSAPSDMPDAPRLRLVASEAAEEVLIPEGRTREAGEIAHRAPALAGSDEPPRPPVATVTPEHLSDIRDARERQRASDSTAISDRVRLAPTAVEAALPQVTPGGRAAGIARTEPVITLREPVRIPMGELTVDRPQRLVLEVDPPALGRCELELSLHDGRVRATVIAERVETALALRAVEGHLREQLAARDLQFSEFDVRTGAQGLSHDGQDRDAARDGERRPRAGSEPPPTETEAAADAAARTAERVRTHKGTIDLMA